MPERAPDPIRGPSWASGTVPVARALRAGEVESVHHGVVAAVTSYGGLVGEAGDSQLATYARSCTKPVQALALLEAGGEERFALDDADLAVICASHGGSAEHRRQVASLLERGGFTVDHLECGVHPPLDPDAAAELARAGEAPTALANNCSGKHAGMLLAAKLLGYETAGYSRADHPLQVANHQRISDFCGLPKIQISTAVDGCSVPTYRMPVRAVARVYAAFADPARAALDRRVPLVERTVAAMTGRPDMVAGPGRFTTRLMEVTGGRLVGKEGAEGLYAVAVRGPAALGVAVKIADGGSRCRDGVVIDVLRQLGSLSAAECQALAEFHRPVRTNHRGIEVGEIVPDVEVHEA